jgi:hypothetical protein
MKEICEARKRNKANIAAPHRCGLVKGHEGQHRCVYGMTGVGCRERWGRVKQTPATGGEKGAG